MLNSPITFDRPEALFILPFAPLIVWLILKFSRLGLSKRHLQQIAFFRTIAVTALCLAAAGIRWHDLSERLTTIYVMDVSDSISIEQRLAALNFMRSAQKVAHSGDESGLVVFGSEPSLEIPPTSSPNFDLFSPDVPGKSTNIETAIDAALGAMPSDTAKRIVLFTDGLENQGDVRSLLPGAVKSGLQIDMAPSMLTANDRPEALINRVIAPTNVSENEPFPLRIIVTSSIAQSARLTVMRDGTLIDSTKLSLDEGKNSFRFVDRLPTTGWHHYEASLLPTLDTLYQNNTGRSSVEVAGPSKILLIRNSNEPLTSALPAALRAQGLAIATVPPALAPQTVSGLSDYDSIILSDVGAGDLTTAQMTNLKTANRDFGIGLGMIGGVNSFGAGGYVGTPIEEALPVLMTPQKRSKMPSADVVIVLDASGSMSAEEDGVEKVEIAARAALNLLQALKPTDRVAVLAVTETAEIVMPLVSPSEAGKYTSSIESVEAGGGGIDCRNGLAAAYTLLQTSDAPIKHVIICPDTTDSEQQEGCVALAKNSYSSAKITTSVCGIGEWSDSDVPFQRSLAAAGQGQLYVANQASNLPLFFQRDVQNIQQKLYNEGDFQVADNADDPVGGVQTAVPNLLGYDVTVAKATATTPIAIGPEHDPGLAYWQDGLGRSFAFTSDDQSHWARPWVSSWQGYAPLMAHIVRWTLKPGEDEHFQSLVTNRNGKGHIVVDAFNSAGFSTSSTFRALIAQPNGLEQNLSLSQEMPGRYEAQFDTNTPGDYLVRIVDNDTGGSRTASVSTAYPPEYAITTPDTELLSELTSSTGGIFLKTPSEVFRPPNQRNFETKSLVKPLLLFGAFAFLLDIAWRRFGWTLRRRHAEQATLTAKSALRTAHQRAAESVSRTSRPMPHSKEVMTDDELLRKRTAVRADLDEDDPFPFVASLPPRQRKERDQIVSKDKK